MCGMTEKWRGQARKFIQKHKEVFLENGLHITTCMGHSFEVQRRLKREGVESDVFFWVNKKMGMYHVWVLTRDGYIVDAYPLDEGEPVVICYRGDKDSFYSGDPISQMPRALYEMQEWNEVAQALEENRVKDKTRSSRPLSEEERKELNLIISQFSIAAHQTQWQFQNIQKESALLLEENNHQNIADILKGAVVLRAPPKLITEIRNFEEKHDLKIFAFNIASDKSLSKKNVIVIVRWDNFNCLKKSFIHEASALDGNDDQSNRELEKLVTGSSVNEKPSYQNRDRPDFVFKPEEFVIYYKKKGEVVTPGERDSIWMSLPPEMRNFYLVTLSRKNTEGIVLLTSNTQFIDYVKESQPPVCETYEVVVKGQVSQRDLDSIKKGILAKVEKSSRSDLVVKKIQPISIEIIEKSKEQTRLELSFGGRSEREVAAIFRKFDYPLISVTRTHLDGLGLGDIKPGQFRRLRWEELLLVTRAYLGESLQAKAAQEVARKQAQEEAEDHRVIEAILNNPQVIEDVFHNIYRRSDLTIEDVQKEDVFYHREGGFKRVYRVSVKIKNDHEKFSFFVKVVKPDVEDTDSGYPYNQDYAEHILGIAKSMRAKDLDLFPPFGGYYLFSDGEGIERIVFTEGIVPPTNAKLTTSQRDRVAIKTYLMYYLISDGDVFFHDPKPDNVIIHKKRKAGLKATVIDVDNVLYGGVSAFTAIYNLILHGYKPADIIDSIIEVFGSKRGVEFIQSSMFMAKTMFSYVMGNFMQEFENRRQELEALGVKPVLVSDTIEVGVNSHKMLIPQGAALLDVLEDCYVDLHHIAVTLNGQKKWWSNTGMSDYRERKSNYQRTILKNNDVITFLPKRKMPQEEKDEQEEQLVQIPGRKLKVKLLKKQGHQQQLKDLLDKLMTFNDLLSPKVISDDTDKVRVRSFRYGLGSLINDIRKYLSGHRHIPLEGFNRELFEKRFSRIGFGQTEDREIMQNNWRAILDEAQSLKDVFGQIFSLSIKDTRRALADFRKPNKGTRLYSFGFALLPFLFSGQTLMWVLVFIGGFTLFKFLKKVSKQPRNFIVGRVLLLFLTVLPMFFSSGCASRQQIMRDTYLRMAQQARNSNNYIMLATSYKLLYDTDPSALEGKLEGLSSKEREQLIDGCLILHTDLSNPLHLEPFSFLKLINLTQEELHQGYIRLFNSGGFKFSFYAARYFAALGDDRGEKFLFQGLRGEFEPFYYWRYPTYPMPDSAGRQIKDHIRMIAAFSLAQLGNQESIDYLISCLRDSDKYNPQARACAAYNLGKFDTEKAKAQLMQAASDSNPQVRAAAIWALGQRQDKMFSNIFISNLTHSNREVVIESLIALARLADQANVSHIEKVFNRTTDREIKKTAILVLAEIKGDRALEIILEKSQTSDTELRKTTLVVLSYFDAQDAQARIEKALSDREPSVKMLAVSLLSGKLNENTQLANKVIELLEKESDNKVSMVCLEALRGIEDKRVRNRAAAFLTSRDWQMRQSALLYMSQYSDTTALGEIIEMTEDVRESIRQTAIIIAAGKLGQSPAVLDALKQKLYDPSRAISHTTAVALSPHIDTYPELRIPINRILNNSDIATQRAIILNLGKTQSEWTVNQLAPYLQSQELALKQAAVISLASMNIPETASLIKPLAYDNNPEIRESLALSLGVRQDIQMLDSVRVLIQDKVPTVREAAVMSFGQIPDAPLDELAIQLEDSNPRVRLAISGILADRVSQNQQLTERFIHLAKTDSSNLIRSTAISALAGINQPQVIEVVRDNFRSNDPQLRQSAIFAAAQINSPSMRTLLQNALSDQNPLIRSSAISGLGTRIAQDPQLISTIKPFIRDSDFRVREAAIRTLGLSENPQVNDAVLSAVKDPAWQVRYRSALVLGKFDTPQIRDSLMTLIDDPNPYVRRAGILSLGDKVNLYPEVHKRFNEISQTHSDSNMRFFSGLIINGRGGEFLKSAREITEIDILVPGVYIEKDPIKFFKGRDHDTDWSNEHLEKNKLIQIGSEIKAFNWSGRIIDTKQAQQSFAKFFKTTVEEAVRFDADVYLRLHSWANPISEVLLTENKYVKDAFAMAATRGIKIDIEGMGAAPNRGLSELTSKWSNVTFKNLWSPADRISQWSLDSNPPQYNIEVPNISHTQWWEYSLNKAFEDRVFTRFVLPQIVNDQGLFRPETPAFRTSDLRFNFQQQRLLQGGNFRVNPTSFLNHQPINIPEMRFGTISDRLLPPDYTKIPMPEINTNSNIQWTLQAVPYGGIDIGRMNQMINPTIPMPMPPVNIKVKPIDIPPPPRIPPPRTDY